MIAQSADQWEALQRAVARELEVVWEQAQRGGTSSEEVERQVAPWSRRIGTRVLEAALQAQVERRERPQVVCCGQPMTREARARREALTMLGAVKIWRR